MAEITVEIRTRRTWRYAPLVLLAKALCLLRIKDPDSAAKMVVDYGGFIFLIDGKRL